jgi:hypothetical protein
LPAWWAVTDPRRLPVHRSWVLGIGWHGGCDDWVRRRPQAACFPQPRMTHDPTQAPLPLRHLVRDLRHHLRLRPQFRPRGRLRRVLILDLNTQCPKGPGIDDGVAIGMDGKTTDAVGQSTPSSRGSDSVRSRAFVAPIAMARFGFQVTRCLSRDALTSLFAWSYFVVTYTRISSGEPPCSRSAAF